MAAMENSLGVQLERLVPTSSAAAALPHRPLDELSHTRGDRFLLAIGRPHGIQNRIGSSTQPCVLLTAAQRMNPAANSSLAIYGLPLVALGSLAAQRSIEVIQ